MWKIALLAALLAFSSADELDPLIQQCSARFNVDQSQLLQLRNPAFQTSDENTKCVLLCVGQQSSLMDATGNIIDAAVLEDTRGLFDQTKVQTTISQCKQSVGTSSCDTAYQQWVCLMAAAYTSGYWGMVNSGNPGVDPRYSM